MLIHKCQQVNANLWILWYDNIFYVMCQARLCFSKCCLFQRTQLNDSRVYISYYRTCKLCKFMLIWVRFNGNLGQASYLKERRKSGFGSY